MTLLTMTQPPAPRHRERKPRPARRARLAAALALALALLTAPLSADDRKDKDRLEEKALAERFKRWMEEVKYILTPEEKDTFLKLTTDEEREAFIDQFWRRRDPDTRTAENEYKEEYYRRIQYANDHYSSAIIGWKTDRGRTYIVFGPPDEIENHPTGGSYRKETWQGGGMSMAHPYQVWRYRNVPWLDGPVEIEFVDKGGSGNYTMVLDPAEKDAMMNTPAVGMLGGDMMSHYDAVDLTYLPLDSSIPSNRYHERLQQFAAIQQAPTIQFQDLRTRVQSREFLQGFPIQFQCYPMWMTTDRAVVPIGLEVENRHLEFVQKFATLRAQVNIYILVEALDGRVVAEFEDQLTTDYTVNTIDSGRLEKSVYQRIVLVPPGRYKVNIAVKDEASGIISAREQGLVITPLPAGSLALSSLILARSIVPVQGESTDQDPFQLGDLRVIPNVTGRFKTSERVGIYGQIYNPTPDSRSQQPRLSVRYQILRDGQPVLDVEDAAGRSVRPSGRDRYVFVKGLPLADLATGRYQLKVTVQDGVAERSATSTAWVELR